jgi:hypothetical protein
LCEVLGYCPLGYMHVLRGAPQQQDMPCAAVWLLCDMHADRQTDM